ncbi:MAG: sulfotransferase [Gammaproteobacteria bacterium]|nr:sulfotransferase [Gammaproteobacteria bacterium]
MTRTYQLRQFRRPGQTRTLAVRVLNAVGKVAPGYRQPDADALWADARKALWSGQGLEVAADAHARQALAQLIDAINSTAQLNFVGRMAAFDDSRRMALNHLRIQALLESQPAIVDTVLPAPIFVIGMPRTGTTYLHTLLAQDPRHRSIPYWESFDPIPPASGPDRRSARLAKMLAQMDQLAPNYQAIHPMTAQSTEECVALFMNNFRTLQFDIQYRVPQYVAWIQAQDAAIAYHGYLQQLKIIQHFRPAGERFVLKDPAHTLHLRTILQVFPDARFVFTHRDPAKSVSSICSLYANTRAMFSDAVDAGAIGEEVLNGYWPAGLAQAMAIRESLPRWRYADVRQSDLRNKPLDTISSAYAQLGLAFDDIAHTALQRHLDAAAQLPRHRHEHSPQGFGLSAAGIRERLQPYVDAFDL